MIRASAKGEILVRRIAPREIRVSSDCPRNPRPLFRHDNADQAVIEGNKLVNVSEQIP